MKSFRWIVVVLMIGLVSVGCQSSSSGTDEVDHSVVPNPATAPSENAYPAAAENPAVAYPSSDQPGTVPTIPYPPPEVQLPQNDMVYPDMKDGDQIDWTQAAGLVYSGQVTKVSQTHDLKVSLTLKDGRTLVTTEPQIDDILKLVQECGDPCKDIRMATE